MVTQSTNEENIMQTIKQVLMERDGISEAEANELIAEAKEAMNEALEEGDMEGAEEICMDYFGLEPDYLMELI